MRKLHLLHKWVSLNTKREYTGKTTPFGEEYGWWVKEQCAFCGKVREGHSKILGIRLLNWTTRKEALEDRKMSERLEGWLKEKR